MLSNTDWSDWRPIGARLELLSGYGAYRAKNDGRMSNLSIPVFEARQMGDTWELHGRNMGASVDVTWSHVELTWT